MTPGETTTPLLRLHDLAVSFGPTRAVDGVSLTIHPRQTLAVVGESGCGKSVTAMSLLQLIPRPPGAFDRGQAIFLTDSGPRDLLAMNQRDIRRIRGGDIAMIFQEPMTSLNPVFTIGDQIIEAVRLHQGLGAKEAAAVAAAALRDVEIDDPPRRMNQYPHEFSGGMRQRVMIAMALACRPRLLLADEPTTALDVTIQAQILALLRRLQRERAMAMMLITHALGIVAQHADVVCVMYAGRVVEYAAVPALFARPLHPYTRGLLASIPSVSTKRDRLATIREIIDDPSEFQRLPGLRPWWPRHDRPADVPATAAPDSSLLELEPGHWVGVWRTAAVALRTATDPDLPFREPD